MRIPLQSPEKLDARQRALYDDIVGEVGRDFRGFKTMEKGGELVGPWNVWLREPKWGAPIWEVVKAVAVSPVLPRPVREVAILVTGAHFRSAYEIYAHVNLAENQGLSDEKIATIVVGQRPSDLTTEESVAYDVASALVDGHVLPALTYKRAVETFTEKGAMELIYLVGTYCLVSVTLNGFDIPVPDDEAR